jgi:glycerol uptake facilitator-like aquaporin
MDKPNQVHPFFICEFLGSMFLVIAAVAPVIFFTQVLKTSVAIAVLADALAVGFILFALIEVFGPICTAYFNPAVSFSMAFAKDITWGHAVWLSLNQILGGLVGILLTHAMFYTDIPQLVALSDIQRFGGTYLAEFLGTFLLVLTILSLVHQKSNRTSLVVGLLVAGMIMATSSTMFANPQVTIARVFTYAAAGVRPVDALVFIAVQFLAGFIAVVSWRRIQISCKRYTMAQK